MEKSPLLKLQIPLVYKQFSNFNIFEEFYQTTMLH
jgi:hypothetical protein